MTTAQQEREATLLFLAKQHAVYDRASMHAFETVNAMAYVAKRFESLCLMTSTEVPADEFWLIAGDGQRCVINAKTPSVCYRDVRFM